MKLRTVLPLLLITASSALAQLNVVSNNFTSTTPRPWTESNLVAAPESMFQPATRSFEPFIESQITRTSKDSRDEHTQFFDRQNLELFGVNILSQTGALLAIQSHGGGGANWKQSRGRTLDPFEKHFESYGYGWGAVYRYGGGVGLNMLATYAFHKTGHHKLERWVPYIAIVHAEASTGFALTGSKGEGGW